MRNARYKAIREKKERMAMQRKIKPTPINEIKFSSESSPVPGSPRSHRKKKPLYAAMSPITQRSVAGFGQPHRGASGMMEKVDEVNKNEFPSYFKQNTEDMRER